MTECWIRLCKVNCTLVRLNKFDIRCKWHGVFSSITLSLWRSLSCRKHSIGLQSKSMDLFFYGLKILFIWGLFKFYVGIQHISNVINGNITLHDKHKSSHTFNIIIWCIQDLLNNWNYPPDMGNIQRCPVDWMIYFIYFKLIIKKWNQIHLYRSNAIFCV